LQQVFLLVRTLEFEVELPEDTVSLRLEIFRSRASKTLFKARIWRLEHFRIQPTFPQQQGRPLHQPSDELVLKEFESFETMFGEPRRARSVRAVERSVASEILAWARSVATSRGAK